MKTAYFRHSAHTKTENSQSTTHLKIVRSRTVCKSPQTFQYRKNNQIGTSLCVCARFLQCLHKRRKSQVAEFTIPVLLDYRLKIQYQTFDVTDMLADGENMSISASSWKRTLFGLLRLQRCYDLRQRGFIYCYAEYCLH